MIQCYKISIITPSFNRIKLIDETAQSIFNQKYTNWEWVIVDDGSTDGTFEKAKQYAAQDLRVKVFRRNRNPKGACTCRNIAVEKSTGAYLIFLDTDDVLAPFCLEQRARAAEKNKSKDFLIFPMLLFEEKVGDSNLLWNVDSNQNDLERLLMGDPICQGSATLWKKESFLKLGMWDESLLLWQDIDLHIRAFAQKFSYSKHFDLRPDLYIRTGNQSLSRTGFHSPEKLRSRVAVVQNAIKLITAKRSGGEKYHLSLHHFIFGVYLAALQGRQFALAQDLLRMAKEHLKSLPISILQSVLLKWIYAFRLYKIPGVQDAINSFKLKHQYTGATLHRVAYEPKGNNIFQEI